MIEMNGLGSRRCLEELPNARQCRQYEVEGMDYCLRHMPDDLLEEAEQITGVKVCRQCREYAADGTSPPACPSHKPAARARAQLALVSGQAAEMAKQIISEHGHDLEHAPPVNDPYGELMAVTGELKVWKDILREKVGSLKKLGYAGKAGEQTMAEVTLYSQALRDLSGVLLSIGRLNIDARLVGVREKTAAMLERALDQAFEEAEVPLDKRAQARDTFRRNLKVVA